MSTNIPKTDPIDPKSVPPILAECSGSEARRHGLCVVSKEGYRLNSDWLFFQSQRLEVGGNLYVELPGQEAVDAKIIDVEVRHIAVSHNVFVTVRLDFSWRPTVSK